MRKNLKAEQQELRERTIKRHGLVAFKTSEKRKKPLLGPEKAGFDQFYVVQPELLRENRFKCGITTDIGRRVSGYMTACPDVRVVDFFLIPSGEEKALIGKLVQGIGCLRGREVIDIDDLDAFYVRLRGLPYKRLLLSRSAAMRALIDRERYIYPVPLVPTRGNSMRELYSGHSDVVSTNDFNEL